MLSGFYSMFFTGVAGSGMGVLAVKNGIIAGADSAGAIYDGTYARDERKGLNEGRIKVLFPPGAALVTGALAGPQPMTLEFPVTLPESLGDEKPISLQTPTGPINVIFRKLRDFPPGM